MISPEQLEALARFEGQGSNVLSAYLDIDPATQLRRSYRVAFEDLVKVQHTRLEGQALQEFSAEAARVQTWLESQEPRGKGLAVFACTPRGLWRTGFLQVRVPNHLTFEPRPDVGPLIGILDEYERYAVALVDKAKARIFSVFAAEIEETDEFEDFVFGKHQQGGWSQARYQRHHEAHVYWHLKRIAQRLAELRRRRRFDRLILAGPEEPVSELRRLLPRALASRVVAIIPAEMFATEHEILQKTLEVERRIERETEESLLAQLMDLAGPGGRSVLGVRPTLAALWADLVQTLVVASSARGDGSDCPNCGRLDPGRLDNCPACGTPMRPVHDIFHRAMQQAVEQSGGVEVVHGAVERRLMDLGAGMGALLRYRSSVPQTVAAAASAREGTRRRSP